MIVIFQLIKEMCSHCGHIMVIIIVSELPYFLIVQPRGGVEEGPTALRKAGLLEKLKEQGNLKKSTFIEIQLMYNVIRYRCTI